MTAGPPPTHIQRWVHVNAYVEGLHVDIGGLEPRYATIEMAYRLADLWFANGKHDVSWIEIWDCQSR